MDLILGFARDDDRVRAVLMNGSRANPNAPPDPFQDYDVVFLVIDVSPFMDRHYVAPRFGDAIAIEEPESQILFPGDGDGHYNYNMQLVDGNRIDLSFYHVDAMESRLEDSMTVVLLDKDGRVPALPPPSEESYRVEKPTQKHFDDCCTAFLFGLSSHVPKTIWRRQLPLLKFYVQAVLRKPLLIMIGWYVQVKCGPDALIGKEGKDLQKYLEPDEWLEFERTCAGSDYDQLWDSLFAFHRLFRSAAESVAREHGFHFPAEQAEAATAFLEHVRTLPPDASTIYGPEATN